MLDADLWNNNTHINYNMCSVTHYDREESSCYSCLKDVKWMLWLQHDGQPIKLYLTERSLSGDIVCVAAALRAVWRRLTSLGLLAIWPFWQQVISAPAGLCQDSLMYQMPPPGTIWPTLKHARTHRYVIFVWICSFNSKYLHKWVITGTLKQGCVAPCWIEFFLLFLKSSKDMSGSNTK